MTTPHVAVDGGSRLRSGDTVVHPTRPWPFVGTVQVGEKAAAPRYGAVVAGTPMSEKLLLKKRSLPGRSTDTKESVYVVYGGETVPVDGTERTVVHMDRTPTGTFGNGQSVAEVTPKMRSKTAKSSTPSCPHNPYYETVADARARRGIVKRSTERVDVMYTDKTSNEPRFIVNLPHGHRILPKTDAAAQTTYAFMHGWIGVVQLVMQKYTLKTADGYTFTIRDPIIDGGDALQMTPQMRFGVTEQCLKNLDVAAGRTGHRHGLRDMFIGERVAVPVRMLNDRCDNNDNLPDELRDLLSKAMKEKVDADITRELERRRRERTKGAGRSLYQWSSTCAYNEENDAVTVHIRQPMLQPEGDVKSNVDMELFPGTSSFSSPVTVPASKSPKTEMAIECRVTTVGVDVQWVRQIYSVHRRYTETGRKAPVDLPRHVTGDDLAHVRLVHSYYGHYVEALNVGRVVRIKATGDERVLTQDEYRTFLNIVADEQARVSELRNAGEATVDASTIVDGTSLGVPLGMGVDEIVQCEVVQCRRSLEVLWESGVMSVDVREDDVVHAQNASYHSNKDRDYYPGMFVEYARNSSMIKDADQEEADRLLSRIGLVTTVKNSEKVCHVQWFERPTTEQTEGNLPVTPVESIQMPFHFITGYRQFNFIMGAMVRIVGERPTSKDMALGIVDHKQSDGLLRVRLLTDMDHTVLMWPWHVAKLSMATGRGHHAYDNYSTETLPYSGAHTSTLTDLLMQADGATGDLREQLTAAFSNVVGLPSQYSSSLESQQLMEHIQNVIGQLQHGGPSSSSQFSATTSSTALGVQAAKSATTTRTNSTNIDMGDDTNDDNGDFTYETDSETEQTPHVVVTEAECACGGDSGDESDYHDNTGALSYEEYYEMNVAHNQESHGDVEMEDVDIIGQIGDDDQSMLVHDMFNYAGNVPGVPVIALGDPFKGSSFEETCASLSEPMVVVEETSTSKKPTASTTHLDETVRAEMYKAEQYAARLHDALEKADFESRMPTNDIVIDGPPVDEKKVQLKTVWRRQLGLTTRLPAESKENSDERWYWCFNIPKRTAMDAQTLTRLGLSKTGRLLDFTPLKCPARRCEVITDTVVLEHKTRLLNHLVDSMHGMFTNILHMVMYMNEAVDGRCCRGELLRLVHSLVTAIDEIAPTDLTNECLRATLTGEPKDAHTMKGVEQLFTTTPHVETDAERWERQSAPTFHAQQKAKAQLPSGRLDTILYPLQLALQTVREYAKSKDEALATSSSEESSTTKGKSTVTAVAREAALTDAYMMHNKTTAARTHKVCEHSVVDFVNEMTTVVEGDTKTTDESTPPMQRCLAIMHAMCRPMQLLANSTVDTIGMYVLDEHIDEVDGYTIEKSLPHVLAGLQEALGIVKADLPLEHPVDEADLTGASTKFLQSFVVNSELEVEEKARLGTVPSMRYMAALHSRTKSLMHGLPAFNVRWMSLRADKDVVGDAHSQRAHGSLGFGAQPMGGQLGSSKWKGMGEPLRRSFVEKWVDVRPHESRSVLPEHVDRDLGVKITKLTTIMNEMSLVDEPMAHDDCEVEKDGESAEDRLASLTKPAVDCRSCTTTEIPLHMVQSFNNTVYDSLIVAACVFGLKVTNSLKKIMPPMTLETNEITAKLADDVKSAALARSAHMTDAEHDSPTSSTTTTATTSTAVVAPTADKALADDEFRATIAKMHAAAVAADVDTSLETQLCESSFELLARAPASHKFIDVKQSESAKLPKFTRARTLPTASVSQPAKFVRAVTKELIALRSSLPDGVMVKAYEDRMDLFSCMIRGPEDTPYDHCLFCFDVRLNPDYPARPPQVFYRSLSDRLNPNLYVDGMVCLSLLGTWAGEGNEQWTSQSTLLQVFLSIQSMVLTSEPYYLEPGFESHFGEPETKVIAREYNENALLLAISSLHRLLAHPLAPWEREIREHAIKHLPKLDLLLTSYIEESEQCRSSEKSSDDSALLTSPYPSLADRPGKSKPIAFSATNREASHLLPSSSTPFNLQPMTEGAQLTLAHQRRALAKAYEKMLKENGTEKKE